MRKKIAKRGKRRLLDLYSIIGIAILLVSVIAYSVSIRSNMTGGVTCPKVGNKKTEINTCVTLSGCTNGYKNGDAQYTCVAGWFGARSWQYSACIPKTNCFACKKAGESFTISTYQCCSKRATSRNLCCTAEGQSFAKSKSECCSEMAVGNICCKGLSRPAASASECCSGKISGGMCADFVAAAPYWSACSKACGQGGGIKQCIGSAGSQCTSPTAYVGAVRACNTNC